MSSIVASTTLKDSAAFRVWPRAMGTTDSADSHATAHIAGMLMPRFFMVISLMPRLFSYGDISRRVVSISSQSAWHARKSLEARLGTEAAGVRRCRWIGFLNELF